MSAVYRDVVVSVVRYGLSAVAVFRLSRFFFCTYFSVSWGHGLGERDAGFEGLFRRRVRSLLPYWSEGGTSWRSV